MHDSIVELLRCPECRGGPLELESYARRDPIVEEGVLRCGGCGLWFRIEHGIADLLPLALRVESRHAEFARRHRLEPAAARPPGDAAKLHQMEFFREDVDRYEEQVKASSFYLAMDRVNLIPWLDRRIRPGMRTMELGCGTGTQVLTLAERSAEVVGLDLSEEMLRVAQRKIEAAGLAGRVTLLVADAEHPPLVDNAFDACLVYGTLHHLPNPEQAIASASRCLRAGGCLFTLDPHKSPLRWLFDAMMKVWKLYDEEAREDPLLERHQLADWLAAAGLTGRVWLSTFLPPHLLHLLPVPVAERLLAGTDAVLRRIPGVRRIAGVILSEGLKEE
jgi:SAM-dependent methyltransferase